MRSKHPEPDSPGIQAGQAPLPGAQRVHKPRVSKESILGNLARFAQDAYHCPFCRCPSSTHEAQLVHLRSVHPWYSLDVHLGTK
ncbi:hypothetical protein H4R19_004908 [Coemansia spiralis]|nr:hypothetical protein H4R19_004908 [Coemansia spiralis]